MQQAIAARQADPTYQMSLDHSQTIGGIDYLKMLGILTADRAVAMLADSTPNEA
jgi:hypothetical protein